MTESSKETFWHAEDTRFHGWIFSFQQDFKSLLEIKEKRVVTGPWVSQNFGQKNADLAWRLGLVRDFMNCASPFSSLGGSSSTLWGLAAISSQTSQGCLLPATSSLLLCPSLSRVSGSPSKGASEVKLEESWSLPQGFHLKTQRKMKISILQDCCLFPVLKRPIIAPSPDWHNKQQKVFVLVSCTWWDVLC